MKINYRVFVSFAMTLQILILLFGIAAIPVAGTPSMPLVLQGTVMVDGEPATVNTQIIAEVNGDIVGSTEVDQEGIYGSQPGNKLYITCESDNYGDIVFYVNGVESQLADADILINANSGDVLESVNMIATSPVSSVDNSGGGGGGGISSSSDDSSSSSTATTSDSSTNDESSSGSIASAGTTSLKSIATTQSANDPAKEDVLESETKPSIMVIVIGAIVLLGIVVTVGYKFKEN